MIKLSFVPPNDPVLIKIAEPINVEEIKSKKYQDLIDSMLTFARGEQDDQNRSVLVGVAAPQVEISKRIILVDLLANGKGVTGKLKVYINPEIVSYSDETDEWYEGCFSTANFTGIVQRPTKILLQYQDIFGEVKNEKFEGYTARIFQHEIDHLNGKEFISHITDENNLHVVKKEQWKEYRNNEQWRNWPHKGKFSDWLKIKNHF